jgi:hypothetical protein
LGENNNQGKKGGEKQPKKWRKNITKLNPIPITFKLYTQLLKRISNFKARFQSLSKKGKVAMSIQILTLMIMLGAGGNRVVSVVRSNSATGGVANVRTMRKKPVEVPYSVFMDLVEQSGKVCR